MTFVILAAAGVGLALMVTGLPLLRAEKLSNRTLPYLRRWRGLAGRQASATNHPTGSKDVKERLIASGSVATVGSFRLEQLVWAALAVAALAMLVTLAMTAGISFDPRALGPLTILVGAIGFVARDRSLTRRVQRRRSKALEELPIAIDLLTLAVMSGETIPAACGRVAGLLRSGIGDEFQAIAADIASGTPADQALENLAVRIPDPAMRRLVDSLCVALDRGAPLADVLRAQSDDLREGRRRRLLEVGGHREVLMLIPVVFLIMPVVVLFALFPGLVSLDLLVP